MNHDATGLRFTPTEQRIYQVLQAAGDLYCGYADFATRAYDLSADQVDPSFQRLIRAHIKNVRAKLEAAGVDRLPLWTRGLGWRLECPGRLTEDYVIRIPREWYRATPLDEFTLYAVAQPHKTIVDILHFKLVNDQPVCTCNREGVPV